MVNRFARLQVPTEQPFNDENVFEDVRARSGSWVVRHSHHDITSLVARPATLQTMGVYGDGFESMHELIAQQLDAPDSGLQ